MAWASPNVVPRGTSAKTAMRVSLDPLHDVGMHVGSIVVDKDVDVFFGHPVVEIGVLAQTPLGHPYRSDAHGWTYHQESLLPGT